MDKFERRFVAKWTGHSSVGEASLSEGSALEKQWVVLPTQGHAVYDSGVRVAIGNVPLQTACVMRKN